MIRRVGFPAAFLGVAPGAWCSPDLEIVGDWLPRGRWRPGFALHTFCDDYRQEFFWRRPFEGGMVALAAGVITAPDFSVYDDDPPEWASYQVWRSALVAAFLQSLGVTVIPVVAFRGEPERFVGPGSVWAVRGPGRLSDRSAWVERLQLFSSVARPSRVLIFGRDVCVPGVTCVRVPLVSSKWATAQKEVGNGG